MNRQLFETVYATPLAVALLKILLHIPALGQYGFFIDEYYYIACSERLAWGYVDHPPLAVFLLGGLRWLFGESIYVLRIAVMLTGAATVFVTALLAREVGGGRFAQAAAALAVVAAPIYTGIDKFYTTNSFEILYWTLAIYLLLRIAGDRSRTTTGSWLLLGGVLGAGLLNKHSMLFLGFAIAVGLVFTRNRRYLATPGPYLAAGLAFALFAPHVLWQIATGWPTLEFMENARAHKNYFEFGDFVGAQILQQHPLLLPLWAGGFFYFAFARAAAPYRIAAWLYGVLFVFFVLLQGKTYYLSPAYPVLYAGGAVWLERGLARVFARGEVVRSAQIAVLGLIALAGAVLAPLSLPLLAPERYLEYERFLGIRPPKLEHQNLAKMPQHFAGMFGFPEQAAAAIAAYQNLDAAERERAIILGGSYGFAGSVEFYARQSGLELPVISGHNNYYLWSRPYMHGPGGRATTVVALGFSENKLREHFDDIRAAQTVHCEYCMGRTVQVTVYICREPKRAMPQLFEKLRRYL